MMTLPRWLYGGTVTGIGVAFALFYLLQLMEETISMTVLIGVLLPLLISILVCGVGLVMLHSPMFSKISPWVTVWLLLGMAWMSVAGFGAVLYGSSAGVITSTSQIPIFATYGCLPGVLTGWYDGRRRVHIEEVSTREEQLAILSRILRHNFRNKMTVILGQIAALKDMSEPRRDDAIDAVLDESEALLQTTEKQRILVETLLEPTPSRAIDADSLLRYAVSDLEEDHPEAQFDLDIETPCEMHAVPEMQNGLRELLENAVVHNDSSPPTVQVEVRCGRNTGLIRIQDDGPGIPEEELALVTGSKTITPLHHGSGLGLRLASLVVDQSGGKIGFSRSEAGGAEVTITLPLSD